MPLRDLSQKVFINVKMQLSRAIYIFILKMENLKLRFILQYLILKYIFMYRPNFNLTE